MPPVNPLPPIPLAYALNAVTGASKSTIGRREAVPSLLAELPSDHAIYIFVPTHALADEYAEKLDAQFAGSDIVIKTYRGLGADDPEAEGHQMCRIAEDAENLQRGGADIRLLCAIKRDDVDVLCPYTRYAVPILIDPRGKDPKEFAIGILGALDVFEIDGFPSTGPVYIHPTFIDEPVQPRPENPHPPALIASSPDPDPMPEPGSFEIEEVYRGAPEKIYQQAVASMDANDWLDLDVAGVEAARRWFVAMQPHDTDELTTTA